MKKKRRDGLWVVLFTVALVACGLPACEQNAPPAGSLPGERVRLEIKDVELTAEVACDDLSRGQGLMHREHLAENAGMLFISPRAKVQSFWMKNTHIPLSIAFIDDNGTILQIEHMRPKDESYTRSMTKVRYALEVNHGWFARNGIQVGDTITAFRDTVGRFNAF